MWIGLSFFLWALLPNRAYSNPNECHENESNAKHYHLPVVEDHWINENKLFFIESSGCNFLTSRQACAVESALRFSGLPVIVVLLSEQLDIQANNATSQLFLLSQREPLHFRTVNVPHLLERAPFGKRAKEIIQYIETSEKVTNHLSDALRLTLIYLYGGWYADLDTVTMKSLVDLDFDVLSTDTGSEVLMRLENLKFEESPNNTLLGKSVANGYFHFGEAQSDFIRKTILLFIHNFNPKIWNSGGAAIMTRMLRWQCGLKPKEKLTTQNCSPEKCRGLHLLPSKYFYPASWYECGNLGNPPQSMETWQAFFKDAYSVDFFSTSCGAGLKVLWREFYGQSVPAYTYLGPLFCPSSFFSAKAF